MKCGHGQIGVSNFQSKHLEAVASNATILPAVDQMQMYVGCSTDWCATNNATIATCKKYGVTFQAYSPLGHGKAINNPVVQAIAKAHTVSPAQICLVSGALS
jgi:2,5-diketo-D-gluconate reductase A